MRIRARCSSSCCPLDRPMVSYYQLRGIHINTGLWKSIKRRIIMHQYRSRIFHEYSSNFLTQFVINMRYVSNTWMPTVYVNLEWYEDHKYIAGITRRVEGSHSKALTAIYCLWPSLFSKKWWYCAISVIAMAPKQNHSFGYWCRSEWNALLW
jgi:hypothetical protein